MGIFSSIILDGNFGRYSTPDKTASNRCELRGVSQVNLLVGPNNSGKSRFLRELARVDELSFSPSQSLAGLSLLRKRLEEALDANIPANTDVSGFKSRVREIPAFDIIKEGSEYCKSLRELIEKLASIKPNDLSITTQGFASSIDHDTMAKRLQKVAEPLKNELDTLLGGLRQFYGFERLYIPTLRGLRRFKGLQDCYAERTRSDYFANKTTPNIFTGLSLYEQVQDLLLGDLQSRELVAKFQNFLSHAFFDEQPVALIPRKNSDVLFIKIGEEEELPVFELGDGIQMIIILTFPLFKLNNVPSIIFIEEPELYLHPGLQRVLLRTLIKFTNYEYFIATHSNHLLDLTLDFDDVSIFTFHKELEASELREKKAAFRIARVSSLDSSTLRLLGTKNSSVFLSNCTIWIEGITDRRYLAKYLTLYVDYLKRSSLEGSSPFQPKEDLHYSFVEYAGSNITHWSFLDEIGDPIEVERLCGRLFLLTDKDASSSKDRRHAKLKDRLGDYYYCLASREIENLLSPEILRRVISVYEGSIEHIPLPTLEEYESSCLGKYIDQLIGNKKKRRGSYASDSGAVSDKLGFCQKALTQLANFDDLTSEAKSLTIKIYDFIKHMNC